jgi:hypothetical protein
VKTRVDATLRDEAARFRLVFTCEDCAHYAAETSTCANGYPNAAHRSIVLARTREIEFCKEFELA